MVEIKMIIKTNPEFNIAFTIIIVVVILAINAVSCLQKLGYVIIIDNKKMEDLLVENLKKFEKQAIKSENDLFLINLFLFSQKILLLFCISFLNSQKIYRRKFSFLSFISFYPSSSACGYMHCVTLFCYSVNESETFNIQPNQIKCKKMNVRK